MSNLTAMKLELATLEKAARAKGKQPESTSDASLLDRALIATGSAPIAVANKWDIVATSYKLARAKRLAAQ